MTDSAKPGNAMRACELDIFGHVQGVSYRATCADMARDLSLTGWVKNADNGSVLIHAQGSPDAVEELIDWCHDGPSAARVDDVEVRDVAPQNFESFEIRR